MNAILLGSLLAGAACAGGMGHVRRSSDLSLYPATRQVEQQDVYHGVTVADPYRWLEDDRAAEVQAWTDRQNARTDAAVARLPNRAAIGNALRTLWVYARQSEPSRHGARLFDLRNRGEQTQDVLWVEEGEEVDGVGARENRGARVLLDPALLPQNSSGQPASLANLAVDHRGELLAYGVSQSGSDWQSLHVRRVATGEDLPDCVANSKFYAPAWLQDGSGFYYIHYPQPTDGAAHPSDGQPAVFLHILGTPEAQDREVFRHPNVAFSESVAVSDDGRWLVIAAHPGSGKNELWAQDLSVANSPVQLLTAGLEGLNGWVGNDAETFILHTTAGAARGRVLRVALPGHTGAPEPLIAEAGDTLEEVHWVGQTLVAKYLHHAHSLVRVHSLQGALLHTLALPGVGTATGFGGSPASSETFYTFQNATTPPTVYRFDTDTQAQSVRFASALPVPLDDLVTEQVFFSGQDGTPLTAFVSHKKDLQRDGKNPTLLYGYGGFNISITPAFSVANAVWMQRGGVYVSAVLRGGGEYGDAWHWAGTQEHKQNVFNDFIATAEFLIAEHYTQPQHLGIHGASNGGLLVGACLTQRPELFGAAVPEVGVLDMLRFERFTAGRYWTEDYGSVDKAADFQALYAYSPLHNLHAGSRYPSTLVITGDHDDRVVPAHSFKFAAALQAAQAADGAPVLLRVLHNTGHGAGRSLEQRVALAGDKLTFLENALK